MRLIKSIYLEEIYSTEWLFKKQIIVSGVNLYHKRRFSWELSSLESVDEDFFYSVGQGWG